MATHRDGGRSALGGFLYQIVGAIGLCTVQEDIVDREDELTVLFSVKGGRKCRVEHEKFEADAIVHGAGDGNDGIQLVQFKYSRQPKPPNVAKRELQGIVRSLRSAGERALSVLINASSCVLITNRPVDELEPSSFDNARDRELWNSLVICQSVDLNRWIEKLERFARDFGCGDEEIQYGIDQLVGQVMRQTSSGAAGTIRVDLVKAFTGHSHAHPIRREDLQGVMERDLRQEVEDLCPSRISADGECGSGVQVREQWEKISRLLYTDNRALVFLTGDGGSGKSTALSHWLFQQLGEQAATRSCVSMIPRRDAISTWMAGIVAGWSALPPSAGARRSEPTERAIERLVVANPGLGRPVLVLGLDGLDEEERTRRYRDTIVEILQWFRREDEAAIRSLTAPSASLIATTRNAAKSLRDFMIHSSSGFRTAWQPAVVSFGDFTPQELLATARASVPELSDRFQAGFGPRAFGRTETIDSGYGRRVPGPKDGLLSNVVYGSRFRRRP